MPSDHNVWIIVIKLKDQIDQLAAEIRSLKQAVLALNITPANKEN